MWSDYDSNKMVRNNECIKLVRGTWTTMEVEVDFDSTKMWNDSCPWTDKKSIRWKMMKCWKCKSKEEKPGNNICHCTNSHTDQMIEKGGLSTQLTWLKTFQQLQIKCHNGDKNLNSAYFKVDL
jgi:hypothetical protein